MTREEWRDIAGYEDLYQVSNFGRVKSLERTVWNGRVDYVKPETIMKINIMTIGYCCVTLTKDGQQEKHYVHRLVADAFIPNLNNFPEVDHIDANPANNKADNLRWVTHSMNMQHVAEMGHRYNGTRNLMTREARRKAALKNRKPVMRSDGVIFDSVNSAAEALGILPCNISNNLHGRKRSCRGFQFVYLDECTC